MNLKDKWISILAFVGMKASDEASEKIQLQAEELDKINAALEASKGHLEAKEKAEADLAAATTALADATTAHATALKAANDAKETAAADLATANARIAELELAAGIDPTKTAKKDAEVKGEDLSYANPEAGHNKFLKSLGIDPFK